MDLPKLNKNNVHHSLSQTLHPFLRLKEVCISNRPPLLFSCLIGWSVMYSNRSRAGLVALIFFAQFFSLISAVPIPFPALPSGPSSALMSNLDGQNLMQLGVGRVVQKNPLHRPISALSPTTGVGCCFLFSSFGLSFILQNVPIDADDQLVPRSKIGDKFKAFFRVCLLWTQYDNFDINYLLCYRK